MPGTGEKTQTDAGKKGFETAERPVDLGELFVPEDGAVLVECMSNLAANEMYREDVGMES